LTRHQRMIDNRWGWILIIQSTEFSLSIIQHEQHPFYSIHAIHSRIFFYTAIATCMALELPHSNFLHHILCIPFILSIFNSQKSSIYPTIMLAIMLLNISTIFDLPHTEPRQPLELTCIEINPRAHKAMLH